MSFSNPLEVLSWILQVASIWNLFQIYNPVIEEVKWKIPKAHRKYSESVLQDIDCVIVC